MTIHQDHGNPLDIVREGKKDYILSRPAIRDCRVKCVFIIVFKKATVYFLELSLAKTSTVIYLESFKGEWLEGDGLLYCEVTGGAEQNNKGDTRNDS